MLLWDDVLDVLQRHGLENPFWLLPDDAWADGADLHHWLERVTARLSAAGETLPALYQAWRVYDDGVTWGSDAGYFLWGGVPHIVDSVYDALIVRPLDQARWGELLPYLPYAPPVLEDVRPAIVPAEATDRDGGPMHTLSAAEFERLFQGTPLRLEHGGFLDFLRTEIDEARAAARHTAESAEQVVFFTY
jgi:hypothetical protein